MDTTAVESAFTTLSTEATTYAGYALAALVVYKGGKVGLRLISGFISSAFR